MAGETILVVEDEPEMRAGLERVLAREGYRVLVEGHGEAALRRLAVDPPALIVLDLGLPGVDGFTVLRRLRSQGFRQPVLLLTARFQEADKVRGLDLGADDYLTKPFSIGELLARLRVLLRRVSPQQRPQAWTRGGVCADFAAGSLRGPLGEQPLSSTEARVLAVLAAAEGVVVPRQVLIREAWDSAVVTPRAVDQVLVGVRRKLAEVAGPATAAWVVTSHGVGYALMRGE
jgi:DNA-binding response OmpR family regulator